ncbi:guanylate kinase, partial [Pisolithus sp. B1]
PLVVFGPSGVGKGTLIKRLFADYPDKFAFSVSHTTRAPRPGETDGKEYHFVSQDTFKSLLSENAFIEHAQFSSNFYGTSVRAIDAVQSTGKRCILDIESQVRPSRQTDLHPVYVFISPPSMAVLRERLRGRATDSEEAIQKRLATAVVEISYAREEGACDYIIVNDDLETAYGKFRDVALGLPVEGDTLPPLND